MGTKETDVVNNIMLTLSREGVTCWKNTRGLFYTMDSVKLLILAAQSRDPARIKNAIQRLRKVRGGIQADGSSDLIGFTRVKITEAHLGKILPVFTSIEVKTPTGYPSEEQKNFVGFVQENGGKAGVARSTDEAKKIIQETV